MISVLFVQAEYHGLEEIDHKKSCLGDYKEPEQEDMPAPCLVVDMLDYQINDSDADDQVIKIKVGIADQEDVVMPESRDTVR